MARRAGRAARPGRPRRRTARRPGARHSAATAPSCTAARRSRARRRARPRSRRTGRPRPTSRESTNGGAGHDDRRVVGADLAADDGRDLGQRHARSRGRLLLVEARERGERRAAVVERDGRARRSPGPVSWPLPAIEHRVARRGLPQRARDRVGAIADLDDSARRRRAGSPRRGSRRGSRPGPRERGLSSVTTTSVGAALGGGLAHERPLAAVAVAARAEHDDQPARASPAAARERGRDRVGLVGVVDDDGERPDRATTRSIRPATGRDARRSPRRRRRRRRRRSTSDGERGERVRRR